MQKGILDYDEWQNNYTPLILPACFAEVFAEHLTAEQIAGLNAGKIVLIRGYWCIQGTHLKTVTQKVRPLPYYLKFKKHNAKVR